MELLRASELADRLSLSRRRFNLAKCVTCLERGLDFGQVHGNGSKVAAARQHVLRDLEEEKKSLPKLRRENLAFEQAYALRSEVDIQVRRVLHKEITGAGSYLYTAC